MGATQQPVDDLVGRAVSAHGNHRPVPGLSSPVGSIAPTSRYENLEL